MRSNVAASTFSAVKVSHGRPKTVQVAPTIAATAEWLAERLAFKPKFVALVSEHGVQAISRSAILRMALIRGLRALAEEYEVELEQ